MTDYVHRVTIAVPEAWMHDANQLALCLGESDADGTTFTQPSYQDAEGHRYAVCSTVVKTVFLDQAAQALGAPEFAPDVDLAAAGRAQGRLAIGSLHAPVIAAPDRIACIQGARMERAQNHIAALGITPVPTFLYS
uniref:hypothetical protein n=1 Tax=Halomonas sp. TaxID=1486246 RepID=UPI0026207EA5|nr:hypothetical protein [Halomonas sp.]